MVVIRNVSKFVFLIYAYMPELNSKIKKIALDWLQKYSVTGMNLSLVNKLQLKFACGYFDYEKTQCLSPDAIFPVYSITKSFISAAILRLYDQKTLFLDDSVSKWLPNFVLNDSITIRHLLNHTSGLADYGNSKEYYNDLQKTSTRSWNKEQFLKFASDQGLLFQPGKGWNYSNIGYFLLKEILCKVTGMTFSDALKMHVYVPLKLKNTFIIETIEDMKKVTPGYSDIFGEAYADVRTKYDPGWVAHGLVASSTSETSKFYKNFICGDFLSKKTLTELLEPIEVKVKHSYFKKPSYSLGLMCDPLCLYGPIFGHGGGGPGYTCISYCLKERNFAISIFCNSELDMDRIDELMFKLFSVIETT